MFLLDLLLVTGLLVWFSNPKCKFTEKYLNTGNFVSHSDHGLVNRTFGNQALFHHLNTGRIRYSDCDCLYPTHPTLGYVSSRKKKTKNIFSQSNQEWLMIWTSTRDKIFIRWMNEWMNEWMMSSVRLIVFISQDIFKRGWVVFTKSSWGVTNFGSLVLVQSVLRQSIVRLSIENRSIFTDFGSFPTLDRLGTIGLK